MAVVQISKIQHRRGKIGSSDLPQLATAEIGWAIDTQQLFIGNGSVAEGAPAVGNTEILTQNSNIFDLLGTYTFKGNTGATVQTGEFSTNPVARTLQQRLDDIVSIKSFGATGDGTTDDTLAIQRAIDEVFLNSGDKFYTSSRRTLKIEAGTYKITSTLYIPPYATLVGDGKEKTVIRMFTNNTPSFATIDGTSTSGNRITYANITNSSRPKYIFIEGITFDLDTTVTEVDGMFTVDCMTESTLSRCKFKGNFTTRQGNVSNITKGINIRGLGATTSENNLFENCEFENLTYGVYSKYDVQNHNIKECFFNFCHTGIDLARDSSGSGSESQGPKYFTISNNIFDKVDDYAIAIHGTTGKSIGHTTNNNTFIDVSNNSNGPNSPQTSVILFGTVLNSSVNDSFQREEYINDDSYSEVPFLPNIEGYNYTHSRVQEKTLDEQNGPTLFTKVPFTKNTIAYIDYVLVKTAGNVTTRTGRITLTITESTVDVTDSYRHIGSNDGNVTFTALMDDFDSTAGNETVRVLFTNPIGDGIATVRYSVSYFA